MSKEVILSSIKEALKNSTREKKEVKKAELNIKNDGDLLENCIANLETNKTIPIKCSKDELQSKVQEILKELKSQKVLHYANLPFDANDLEADEIVQYDKTVNEMSKTLFECDTSIINARLAVSNLGIFCVTSDEQPRIMSLLPPNCIVLIKKEDVVASINEANTKFAGNMPTNVVYISGPSRTADIELQVCLGVHGPSNVYALFY